MLCSSCGQVLGFPGQASYSGGTLFLDGIGRGDVFFALQWSSWRGLGVAAPSPEVRKINEMLLKQRGVVIIFVDEAFHAWDHLTKCNISHAAIIHYSTQETDSKLCLLVLEYIIPCETPSGPVQGSGEAS